MRIVVLDAATLGDDLSIEPLSSLGNLSLYRNTSVESVAARVQNAEVVVANKVRLNEKTVGAAPQLRLICVTATGYDNVDVAWCRSRGIAVCNVEDYSSASVAQITMAQVLALSSHLRDYTEYVRSGGYTAGGVANRLTPVYHELDGCTWGILGLGHIGRRVARCAQALGCRVVAYCRHTDAEYPCLPLWELLSQSDVVSIHLPLTDGTRHLIGESELSRMKPGAILVNMGRGAIVNEGAVAAAIESGRLGGFGTDVYDGEPLNRTSPLYRLREHPQVCMTPHMAWGSCEARRRCLAEVMENIRAFTRGERRCRVD